MMASVRKKAWSATTRYGGRGVLSYGLKYYKFNPNHSKNILNAYDKYLNSLETQNRELASKAATKLVNTMFKIYENRVNNRYDPVANGVANGVQKSLIYWIPGVLARRVVRWPRKARSAPARISASKRRVSARP